MYAFYFISVRCSYYTNRQVRIFVVMAKYCVKAVWLEDRKHLTSRIYHRGLLSISLLLDYFCSWWCDIAPHSDLYHMLIVWNRNYELSYKKLSFIEAFMDSQASFKKRMAWLHGLWSRGLIGAHDAAFGLPFSSSQ